MKKDVKKAANRATVTAAPIAGLKDLSSDIDELASMRDILEMAIRREESAHEFYMIAHSRACHRMDKELFLRLAQEELLHKQNLQRQLDEVNARIFTDAAMSSGEISGD